jgi:hypothetical protein
LIYGKTPETPRTDVDNIIMIRLNNGNCAHVRIVHNNDFGFLVIRGTPKLFMRQSFELPITRKALVEYLKEDPTLVMYQLGRLNKLTCY